MVRRIALKCSGDIGETCILEINFQHAVDHLIAGAEDTGSAQEETKFCREAPYTSVSLARKRVELDHGPPERICEQEYLLLGVSCLDDGLRFASCPFNVTKTEE